MNPPTAKTTHAPWLPAVLFAIVMAGLLTLFSFIANLDQETRRRGVDAPDDVQAARELLSSKFSGPRYFQMGAPVEGVPYPCIPVERARHQIASVMAARQLPAEATAEIERIISDLTLPAASRVIGTYHVNTLQLNLALDKLH